jgi:hypothetical protein
MHRLRENRPPTHLEQPTRPELKRITDIDNQASLPWKHVDPRPSPTDLEARDVVLEEDGDRAVVCVRSRADVGATGISVSVCDYYDRG